jgi:hypothetical protein
MEVELRTLGKLLLDIGEGLLDSGVQSPPEFGAEIAGKGGYGGEDLKILGELEGLLIQDQPGVGLRTKLPEGVDEEGNPDAIGPAINLEANAPHWRLLGFSDFTFFVVAKFLGAAGVNMLQAG